MPVNRVAENALGTMGTICWTVQLIPQIWLTYRTKSTAGLSEWLMLTWGIAGAFLGTYTVVQNLNVPLIVQPQLFGTLSFVSWAQCQYYGRKRSKVVSIALYIVAVALCAGFEIGMIFAIMPAYKAGNFAPVQFFGIASIVLIAGALLPQYYEIYRYKEVVGMSVTFMIIDLLGGVFNDLSLGFKDKFDVVAGVTYSLVVVMDGIVILCALILNPLAKQRRKRQAAATTSEVEATATCIQPLVAVGSANADCTGHPSLKGDADAEQRQFARVECGKQAVVVDIDNMPVV